MSARTWTPEQRQRQREAIQRWKPWQKSTGPTSVEGANVSAQNAFTGGAWLELRKLVKTMNEALRQQKDWAG